MRRVKFALPFVLCLAFALSACNTIENRRSLYSRTKVDGPATRSLADGSWRNPKSVDEQYAESQLQKKQQSRISSPAPAAPSATVQ